ncbi:hypothetical protein [Paraburkholderia phenoliruptrix]|uniref:hypothetical protein n=1 Tax=Paraburkholderia phenoliruptrix TaxID=252970 RepID=UPI002855E66C|nr:hypothetical protein [Paraburkholderia phenoliruptrix]MDR6391195.1 hypothetical protein [Paraburkholderia phenoliruptrix]
MENVSSDSTALLRCMRSGRSNDDSAKQYVFGLLNASLQEITQHGRHTTGNHHVITAHIYLFFNLATKYKNAAVGEFCVLTIRITTPLRRHYAFDPGQEANAGCIDRGASKPERFNSRGGSHTPSGVSLTTQYF